MNNQSVGKIENNIVFTEEKVRYVLYARKSTESDEQQALSIDSQIKEMTAIAERLNLNVISIKKESHSAKASGQRPVFKELLEEINKGIYNGILTWAPDRLSRNAGDLGTVVDLMDEKKLIHIQTYGQTFSNSPNEKFLLMILCSQAKLENDNKSINVKRGMRAVVEMGLFPGRPPTGYLPSKNVDEKCLAVIDEPRANIVREVFEKIAYQNISARKVYDWLIKEKHFKPISNKTFSLGNYYLMLHNTFYYGVFEYPKNGGQWYKGKHIPIISKEVFDLAQKNIKNQTLRSGNYEDKEFAFTKLLTCSYCGSGITADEKIKKQKNGNIHKYIYYRCTKVRNRDCEFKSIREEDLIEQLKNIVDTTDINKIHIKEKISNDIKRYKLFQAKFSNQKINNLLIKNIDIQEYIKFILDNGKMEEKREVLGCFKDKINI
ncbi:MAG: recombinase family protein [Candidatus Nomurabacteria bacterium]